MDREQQISEFLLVCQVLQSIEADFEKKTWTFGGETMLVSGGDYVIVRKADFHGFIQKLQDE